MKKQAGFTLIEISIVLVIIGLLLGGVLKGQQLIENAKIKRVNNDFTGIGAAVYAYIDRYNALPGDDINAKVRWSSLDEGDGNGSITGDWDSTTAGDESYELWSHLRQSNLIGGAGSTAGAPVNAYGGLIGIQNGAFTAADGLVGTVICMNNVRGEAAEIIDNQLDDGKRNSGILMAHTAIDAKPDATTYTGSTNYIVCKLL